MERRLHLRRLLEEGGLADTAAGAGSAEPELLRLARDEPRASGAMVRVCHGLFLGNAHAARDRERLRRSGVSAVCAVGCRQVFHDDLAYHRIPVKDDGSQSMLSRLDFACDFIHQQRASGAVLVHCQGGISRSPAVVIAYLMKHEQLSLPQAAEVCCLARPAASPRGVFLQDLRQFAATLRGGPRPVPDDAQRREEAVRTVGVEAVAAPGGRPAWPRDGPEEPQPDLPRRSVGEAAGCAGRALGGSGSPEGDRPVACRREAQDVALLSDQCAGFRRGASAPRGDSDAFSPREASDDGATSPSGEQGVARA